MTVAGAAVRPDRIARGIAFILLSTFFTASQDAIFKYASADVTLWQVYVLRSLFLIPAFLVIASLWGDGLSAWHQSLRLWPMSRAMLFVLMYFSMYAAIPLLPEIVSTLVNFYLLMVLMRLLGLMYYCNREKFGWFSRH